MASPFQRSCGVVVLMLAVLLFVLSVTWLAPTIPENTRPFEFLPVQHETLSIQVGNVVLALSRERVSHIVMVVSVLLGIVGGLFLWRPKVSPR